MPRFARVVVPGYPHHVTQRGNERRDLFFSPADREVYLGLLAQYAPLYFLEILGYCLMTNHVHLVVLPHGPNSMAKVLREVQMRYSQYRHALERGNGHLWQSRYYSCVVDPDRLGLVTRYVELNPVRAGMVADPMRYPWSSAAAHVCGADGAGLLAMDAWHRRWTSAEWQAILGSGAEDADGIREATHSGRPLGSREFVSGLEKRLNRRLTRGVSGRPKKRAKAASAEI